MILNESGNLSALVFCYYFDPRSGSAKARYGGDIAEWKWKQSGQGLNSYEFTYDALGRVLSYDHVQSAGWDSHSSTPISKPFTEAVTYDKNGNILTMQRKGTHMISGVAVTDNLIYHNDGNKLGVLNHDDASGNPNWMPGPYSYNYDENGNMTKDSRAYLSYGYNCLNLLGEVKNSINNMTKATYRWLADGTKAGVKNPSGTSGFEYLGSMVYARNPQGGIGLESTSFGGGRVVKTSGGYEIHYQVTDHLGNVRAVHYDNTTSVTSNDYYAFGKRHNNSSLPIARGDQANRWQFNGKEKQLVGDVGFLDFGARMYNPEIARMQTPDPLAEADRKTSPFAYARNNPMNAIDLEGKLVIFINGLALNKSQQATSNYWEGFDTAVMGRLNDNNRLYRHGGNAVSPLSRMAAGYQQAKLDAEWIMASVSDENGNATETIKIVTHSMGAAFGKGYVKALREYLKKHGSDALISLVADFDPFQASDLEAEGNVFTQQFTHKKKGEGDYSWLANDRQGNLRNENYFEDPNQGSHSIPSFFNDISNLKEGTYKWNGNEWVLQN